MLTSRLVAISLALGLLPHVGSSSCGPRDFLSLDLPREQTRPAIAYAMEIAYPGVHLNDVHGTVVVNGVTLPLGKANNRSMAERIARATIRDQFALVYPLSFDLASRETSWFDPGRVRNDPLFRALYGTNAQKIAVSLKRVTYSGPGARARFAMTTRHCVAAQLQAALDAIAAEGAQMAPFFETVGGSFNWRVIAGTNRLSAHSFGIAVDFNTRLGSYWRWSGEREGAVGAYDNRYPEALVHHMERFGFIWGGKSHHYDGMHFEYRPELILYARLMGEAGP